MMDVVGGGMVLDPMEMFMDAENMVGYNLTPPHYGYHHHHEAQEAAEPAASTEGAMIDPATESDGDDARDPRLAAGFLRGTKITLEAAIKTSTDIPFCQFPDSPCAYILHPQNPQPISIL